MTSEVGGGGGTLKYDKGRLCDFHTVMVDNMDMVRGSETPKIL